MTLDDLHRSIAAALRRLEDEGARREREQARLAAKLDHLIEILAAGGTLGRGHPAALERSAQGAAAAVAPRVVLRAPVDKYRIVGPDIDCTARLPLCRARCCAFSFALCAQDLDEGVIRWELERPYLIRHEEDGYCTHLDRATLGCTVHARRPATCRGYDCREDARVWRDFEGRVPEELPDKLKR